jgi:hypothetical protein
MKLQSVARALVARNLSINFLLNGHKDLRKYLWTEGTIK